MASFVLKNAYVELYGSTMTSYVRSITINYEADTPEDTAMGDDSRSYIGGGLKNWSADIEFNQDFAASGVDATLFSSVGTTGAFLARSTTSAIGSTNPEFSGTCILNSYPPIGGAVGDEATVSATFQGSGDLSRATA